MSQSKEPMSVREVAQTRKCGQRRCDSLESTVWRSSDGAHSFGYLCDLA